MIPEIDIWRAAQLMLKRYGDKALEESAARADELVAAGDDNGAAVWRRITTAVVELANMRIPIVVRIGSVRRLSLGHRPLSASADRPYDQCQREWSKQLHFMLIGSISLGSLFFTLPTRMLTGQQVISSDG